MNWIIQNKETGHFITDQSKQFTCSKNYSLCDISMAVFTVQTIPNNVLAFDSYGAALTFVQESKNPHKFRVVGLYAECKDIICPPNTNYIITVTYSEKGCGTYPNSSTIYNEQVCEGSRKETLERLEVWKKNMEGAHTIHYFTETAYSPIDGNKIYESKYPNKLN